MKRWMAALAGLASAALVAGPPPALATTDDAVQRVAGTTRITTAVAVSKATFASADTALLARADTYPDALTGTVLAHAEQAPLLLTNRDGVPEAVTAELDRLGVERVILLGGTAAISNAVRDDLAATHTVSRVGGPTRWATAVEVAEEVSPSPATVVLATGEQFPDAVAVSAYAAAQGWPVLLTARSHLPPHVEAFLHAARPVRIVPVGGSAAISNEVLAGLEADGHTVADRLAGPTRWATSHRIATAHATTVDSPTDLWLATGQAFPDALTAGVAAAANGAVLQLTPTQALDVPDSNRDALARLQTQRACDGTGSFTDVVLVGGIAALTDAVRFQAWTTVTCTGPAPGLLAWRHADTVAVSEPGGVHARVVVDDLPTTRRHLLGPRFSPHASRLVVSDGGDGPLTFIDLATGAVRAQEQAFGGVWSPDGTLVAYSDYGDVPGGSEYGLHVAVADADGSNRRKLVENLAENRVVGWSSAGDEVYYVAGADDIAVPNRLHAVAVETGRTRQISGPDAHSYHAHTLGPDRTHVAVIETDEWDAGDPDILWLVDVTTGEKQSLVSRDQLRTPVWSPEGSEIAVWSSEGPIRVDVATGTVTPITRGDDVLGWSPDGSHLLVTEAHAEAGDGRGRLVALDADGADATVLTPYYEATSRQDDPDWSPDGQWVVHSADLDEDGVANIHQVSVDGQHRFQLTTHGGRYPTWQGQPGHH